MGSIGSTGSGEGLPQASGGAGRTADAVLGLLPEWVELTFFALIVLALLVSWGVGFRRRLAKRRAVRDGLGCGVAKGDARAPERAG